MKEIPMQLSFRFSGRRVEVAPIDRSGAYAGEPPSGCLMYASLERQISGQRNEPKLVNQMVYLPLISSKQPNPYLADVPESVMEEYDKLPMSDLVFFSRFAL